MLFLKYLIVGCLVLSPVNCTGSDHAVPPGFIEGDLHISSPQPVELADGNPPPVTAETYAEYPLIILSQDGKKQVALLMADGNGHYRQALPPRTYILDVQDRVRKHVHAKPVRFTVVTNQTVRVNMDIDTGVR
jgi:hypothetical protein